MERVALYLFGGVIMGGVTAAGLANALKYVYLPRLRNEIKKRFLVLKVAQEAEKTDLRGRSMIVKLKTGKTAGISKPSASGAAFPTATQGSYEEAIIPLARILGTIELTREEILRAQTDAASIVRPLQQEMGDMKTKLQEALNYNFLRTSTDTLATVASFSSGTPDTVTLDGPDGCRMLEPGMVIDFYRAASPVSNGTSITITAITGENTFTCTMSGTPADGDTVQWAGSYGNGAQGLDQIIAATGTFQTIASASYYWWQANVQDDSATPVAFSPRTLKNLLTQIQRRIGGERIDLIVTSPEVYNAMGWVLMNFRWFTQPQPIWEGFWKSFTWDGYTVLEEPDCPPQTIFLLTKKCLIFGNLGEDLINIVDFDGTTTRMALSSGAYINSLNVHFDCYAQLGCTQRPGLGKWTGVKGLNEENTYGNLGGLAA